MRTLTFILLLFFNSFVVTSKTAIETIAELYGQRSNSEKLDECIQLCEKELAASKSKEVSVYLAKAFYFKGEKEIDKTAKLELFDKGVKAGEIGLSTIESYAKIMVEKSANEEEALKQLQPEDIDVLYWTAANLARYAKYASFSKKLAVKNRVRLLWDKILIMNPDYNYGGAYRFFGGYFALVPSITGEQDPVKSKDMFDKAVNSASQYLETKVLYAEAYCTHAKVKDTLLFEKLLNEVIAEDVSDYSEILPENENAKLKAKALLEKEKELFE